MNAVTEFPRKVVFIHGLHSSPEEMVFLVSGLQRQGISCEVLQIPGYTASLKAPSSGTPVRWQDWQDQLIDQLMALHAKEGPVVLSGISTGANLCLAIAQARPDLLAGVAPMSTSLFLDGWSVPPYGFLVLLAYYTPLGRFWRYREKPPYGIKDTRIRRWIEMSLNRRGHSASGHLSIPNAYLRENHRLIRHLRSWIPRHPPTVPLLAIHAQEDELASLKNLHFLTRHWASTQVDTMILKDSYHMVCVDQERTKIVDALSQFARSFPAESPHSRHNGGHE